MPRLVSCNLHVHTVTKFTLATRSLTITVTSASACSRACYSSFVKCGIRAAGPGRLGGHLGCPGRAAPAGVSTGKLCVCVSHAERLRSCIKTSQCAFPLPGSIWVWSKAQAAPSSVRGLAAPPPLHHMHVALCRARRILRLFSKLQGGGFPAQFPSYKASFEAGFLSS